MSRCRRVRNCTDFNITKNFRTAELPSGKPGEISPQAEPQPSNVACFVPYTEAVRKNAPGHSPCHRRGRVYRLKLRFDLAQDRGLPVVNLDLLTYAGNPANLASLGAAEPPISLSAATSATPNWSAPCFDSIAPAPSSTLPRRATSIAPSPRPRRFIRTNVQGTFVLLEQARIYWSGLDEADRAAFRFLHVSTDEVYGSLGGRSRLFRDHGLRAQQPLRRLEGSLRSPGRAPITTPGAFPCSPPTAPTTTARFSFLRSSFRW